MDKDTKCYMVKSFFIQNPPFRIRGCVLTVVERMDEEFTKMLQACDAHSTEYIERLVKHL